MRGYKCYKMDEELTLTLTLTRCIWKIKIYTNLWSSAAKEGMLLLVEVFQACLNRNKVTEQKPLRLVPYKETKQYNLKRLIIIVRYSHRKWRRTFYFGLSYF